MSSRNKIIGSVASALCLYGAAGPSPAGAAADLALEPSGETLKVSFTSIPDEDGEGFDTMLVKAAITNRAGLETMSIACMNMAKQGRMVEKEPVAQIFSLAAKGKPSYIGFTQDYVGGHRVSTVFHVGNQIVRAKTGQEASIQELYRSMGSALNGTCQQLVQSGNALISSSGVNKIHTMPLDQSNARGLTIMRDQLQGYFMNNQIQPSR